MPGSSSTQIHTPTTLPLTTHARRSFSWTPMLQPIWTKDLRAQQPTPSSRQVSHAAQRFNKEEKDFARAGDGPDPCIDESGQPVRVAAPKNGAEKTYPLLG